MSQLDLIDAVHGADPATTEAAPGGADIISLVHDAPQAASAQVQATQDIQPDKAIRSINLEKATGAPALGIHQDLDRFEQTYNASQSAIAVDSNPWLANYVNSHPLAAAASKDELGVLDEFSKSLGQYFSTGWAALGKRDPEAGQRYRQREGFFSPLDPIGVGLKAFGQSMYEQGLPGKEVYDAFSPYRYSGALAWLEAVGPATLMNMFGAGIEGVKAGTKELARQYGYNDNDAERIANTTAGMAQYYAMGTHAGDIPEIAEGAVLHARIARLREKIDPYVKDRRDVPKGVIPEVDEFRASMAKEDNDKLNEWFDFAQKAQKTREAGLLPDNFLEPIVGNSRIEISAEAIRKLYGEKVPEADDNLLGWVPGIAEELPLAEATGGDISIPLKDWLNNMADHPDVAKELNDDIRLRPNGFSLNEAKEFKEARATLPSPPPEVYHGTGGKFDKFADERIGTGQGSTYGFGHYLAEEPGVAETYKKMGGVWEVREDTRHGGKFGIENVDQAIDMPGFATEAEAQAKADELNKDRGNLYHVRIKREQEEFLDWDKPFEEQTPYVQEALEKVAEDLPKAGMFTMEPERTLRPARIEWVKGGKGPRGETLTGADIYSSIVNKKGDHDKRLASELLAKHGIAGVRYLDQFSRKEGKGTSNYVVFQGKDLDILARNNEKMLSEAPLSSGDVDVDNLRQATRTEPIIDPDRAKKLTLLRTGGPIVREEGEAPIHTFDIMDQAGNKVGGAEVSTHDAGKSLRLEWIGTKSPEEPDFFEGMNQLGTRAVMDLVKQMRQEFPDAEEITALRAGGARTKGGIEEPVEIKVKLPLRSPTLDDIRDFVDKVGGVRLTGKGGSILPATAKAGKGRTYTGYGKDIPILYSFSLKDAVDAMDTSHLTGINKDLYNFFADRIKAVVGDLPSYVIPEEEAKALLDEQHGGENNDGRAFYDPNKKVMVFPESYINGKLHSGWTSYAVIHEAAHALTFDAIRDDPVLAAQVGDLRKATASWLKKNMPNHRFAYALSNDDEFLAQAFSEPEFQHAISLIEIPKEFAKYYNLPEKLSLWDAFKEMLKNVIEKAIGKRPDNSIMDALLDVGRQIEEKYGPKTEPRAFISHKELGMSKERYDLHMKAINERRKQDLEANVGKYREQERKRQTKEWKENRKAMREETEPDIMARPDVAAHLFFDKGIVHGGKLNKRYKLNEDMLTPEQKALLPEQYVGKDGLDPDQVAGIFGFTSKDALVNQLGAYERNRKDSGLTPTPYLKKLIDDETDRRMEDRYGNLDRNIVTDTIDRAFNQGHIDLLHEQMLYMAEKAGAQAPLEGVEKWLTENFRNKKIGDLSSTKLVNDLQRIGNRVHLAYLKEDYTTAFKHAQEQYFNAVMIKKVRQLEKTMASFEKTYKRMAKREPGNISQEYANFIHVIYDMVGRKIGRTAADLAHSIEKGDYKDLADFVTSKNDDFRKVIGEDVLAMDDFKVLDVPPFLYNGTFKPKAFDDLTVDEFMGVNKAIKTMIYNGRADKRVMVGGQQREIAEIVDGMIKQIEENFAQKEPGAVQHQPGIIRVSLASLLNLESIFNRFDLNDPNGIFTQSVIRRAVEAVNSRAAMEKVYAQKFRELGDFGRLRQKVSNTLILDPLYNFERPMEMTRENLLATLSNMGNWSNRDKFARGFSSKEHGVEITPEQVMQWVFDNTTKEDWDRAQKLGDIFGELFDKAEEMYLSLSGVIPERLELEPIVTPFGTYKGWYHPAIYDPLRPKKSGRLPDIMDEGNYYQPMTASGYAQKRTGYAQAMLLNFDGVPRRMMQIINDINLRPAVTDISKIFRDGELHKAIATHFGKEYGKDFLISWLRDVAGQRQYRSEAQAAGARIVSTGLHNVVATLIGFNPHTVIKHGLSAAINSMAEVGYKDFWEEFGTMWLRSDFSTDSNWNFAMGRSEELQRRMRHWRETFGGAESELFKESLGEKKRNIMREIAIEWGSKPVAMSDLMSAVPTWLAKYKQVLREGRTEGDAIFEADRAVRNAHGSTAVTSRPAAMRGGPMSAVATPLYGFFSRMFQNTYRIAWESKEASKAVMRGDIKEGLSTIPHIMGGIFSYIIFPALVEQMVTPIHFKPGTSDTQKAAEIFAKGTSSQIPVVRDAVAAYLEGYDPSVGLYNTPLKALQDFARDISKGSQSMDRRHMGKTIKDATVMFGMMTGLTNATEGKVGEFVYNYATGQDIPHNMGDLYRGITQGTTRVRR